MKRKCLPVLPVAMVVLVNSVGCSETNSSDTDGSDDTGDTSVCAGNTEQRSEDDTLIADFDVRVTEHWGADNTLVELVDDEGSTVFHWNRGDADSTTLVWPSAMVNSEGTSLCTDASAFSGIRLDIKGSVSTTGVDYWGVDWTDTVSVGVVAAATYEVEWGGDALANCGNYFWPVPITSSWQTVELDFSDIQEPWNLAACPDVASLPVDQVMGIALSIDSTYTDFDVYVDNIAFK